MQQGLAQLTQQMAMMSATNKYLDNKTGTNWQLVRLLVSYGSLFKENSFFHDCPPELMEMLILAGITPRAGIKYMKPKIKQQIVQNPMQVASLKHLSRLTIRAACKRNPPIKFRKLNGILPPALVSYLRLPEIDEIEEKYKFSEF